MKRHKLIKLMLTALSMSLLAACNGGPQAITPYPKPSSNLPNSTPQPPQPGAVATPPPIPTFTPQILPTPVPGNVGGTRFGDGSTAEMSAGVPAMAPMPASAGGSGGGGGGAYSSGDSFSPPGAGATSPSAVGKPGDVSIMPIMPGPFPEPNIKPEAGLLTAGEWDDIKNWSYWLGLLNDQEYSSALSPWGLNTRQRVLVKVTGTNGVLADVPVSLSDGQNTLFEARTNTQGEAVLFASLLKSASGSSFTLKANLGNSSVTQDITLSDANTPIELKTEAALEPAVNADMMLVIDTTGSMGDEMAYLNQELKDVAERIVKLNRQDLTLRLSANFYKDTTDTYVVKPFPFTSDIQTVANQLANERASGGGDFPEAVDVALADAVDEHAWSPTARARLLFLVLDAPSHDTEAELKRLQTSLTRAAAKGIRIIPVASSGINKETEFLLRQLAITTGGRYVFLTDDSGIGGGHIKPTIGEHKVEKLNDLMVRIATEYITGAGAEPKPIATASPTPTPSPTATPDQQFQQ